MGIPNASSRMAGPMRQLTPQALEGEIHRPIEVTADDMAGLRSDAVVACVRRTLTSRGIVCFRLPEFSNETLFDIASVVGEPAAEGVFAAPASATTRDGLHLLADPIWRPSSPGISLLTAGAGAGGAGGLIAVSRVEVWEMLSPAMRCYLAEMEASHDASLPLALACETPDELRGLAALRERYPPRRNALSVRLGANGKTALGVSPSFTAAIHGVPVEEGRAILDYLKALFDVPDIQHRIEWEEGLVVIWDPRVALLFPFGDSDLPFPVCCAPLKVSREVD